MSAGAAGVSAVGVAAAAGLGMTLVVQLVRSKLRERRHARFLAQLAERYKQVRVLQDRPGREAQEDEVRPRAMAHAPRRVVMVAELVARIEADGLPVRLGRCGQGDDVGADV